MTELQLSPRQIEVCVLIAAGESDKRVARELGISARTVRQHMNDAAARIRQHMPALQGSPRKIILGYYVEYAGVAAFQRRREIREAA